MNARDSRGQTPLHYAARFGSFECGKILLEKGADPRLLTFMDHSPMYMCMSVLGKLQFKNPDTFDYFPPPAMKDCLLRFREMLKKAGASVPKLSTYGLPPQPLRARSSLQSPKKRSPATSPPYSPPRGQSPPPIHLTETPQYVSQQTFSVQDFGPQPGAFTTSSSPEISTPNQTRTISTPIKKPAPSPSSPQPFVPIHSEKKKTLSSIIKCKFFYYLEISIFTKFFFLTQCALKLPTQHPNYFYLFLIFMIKIKLLLNKKLF